MKLSVLFLIGTIGVGSAAAAEHVHEAPKKAAKEPRVSPQPRLALDGRGRVWLAHGEGSDVFVARSDDGGKTFAPAIKIATVPKLMLGMRRGPRLVVHEDRLTVTVIGEELIAFSSTDAGKTWSEPATINDVPGSAREGLHDLALSPTGELFVTWLDLRNGRTELWGASSADGRAWKANARIYASPEKTICECCHPSALFDARGALAVMWRNAIDGSRDMWMAVRAPGAAAFSPARKLGEGTWKIAGCPMDGGRLIALGDGKFGAVWQRNGEIFFSPPEGSELSLGPGKQPAIASVNGERVVVFQRGDDLMIARGDGSAPSKRAGTARFPVIVATPDGRSAVLAYEQGPTSAGRVVVEPL